MIPDLSALRPVLTAVLLAFGCFMMLSAAIGMVRFPDFYSRIHPASNADTLGILFILAGLAVHEGLSLVSLKLLIIMAFLFIASPTATHALAKAAHMAGLKHWKKDKDAA